MTRDDACTHLIDIVADTSQPYPPVFLEVFGATASCAEGELLWSSSPAGASWKTYCAVLTPTHDATYARIQAQVVNPIEDGGLTPAGDYSPLYVDHIVPVPSCQ